MSRSLNRRPSTCSSGATRVPISGWTTARLILRGPADLRPGFVRLPYEDLPDGAANLLGGRLPLTLQGAADPIPVVYESPVPSAQLKSAVLLAGLAAPGETTVIEAEASRDHTERMLKHFGAKIVSRPHGEHGRRITLQGQPELEPAPVLVPADPSSAAFPLVAALIVPGSELVLEAVMTNPLRTGLVTTLREMGASIEAVETHDNGGEEIAEIKAHGGIVRQLPEKVRQEWAKSLADWPAQKAKELDAKGLPATQVLETAIQAAEDNGYKWPVRYKIK